MLELDNDYYAKGFNIVCGIDEAGRGPIFGSVVAACVVFDKGYKNDKINDSKKITPNKREELYDIIVRDALDYSIGVVDAQTIDQVNILQATILAMRKAVDCLKIKPDIFLVDGKNLPINDRCVNVIKGDSLSLSIAAASILAKVTRDKMCFEWDVAYPGYGIEKHKGYPTSLHYDMIRKHGISELHRKSFLKNFKG